MGTHPIFESDFDCLTGMDRLGKKTTRKKKKSKHSQPRQVELSQLNSTEFAQMSIESDNILKMLGAAKKSNNKNTTLTRGCEPARKIRHTPRYEDTVVTEKKLGDTWIKNNELNRIKKVTKVADKQPKQKPENVIIFSSSDEENDPELDQLLASAAVENSNRSSKAKPKILAYDTPELDRKNRGQRNIEEITRISESDEEMT